MAQCRLLMHSCLISLILCLLASFTLFGAEPPQAEAFSVAQKAFADGFYERAEKELAEFLGKFPNSEFKPKAILLQAQARHNLKKYDAAIQLLDANIAAAGPLAPDYLYTRAESLLEKTDFSSAAAAYRKILADAPSSPYALPAAFNEALSFYRTRDFSNTVELLGAPAGSFQTLAITNLTNTVAIRGFLLLGESQLALNKLPEVKSALAPLSTNKLPPDLDWERFDLLARADLLSPQPETALQSITNSAALAISSKAGARLAQTWNLEAEVFKKLNQPEKVLESYEKIITGELIPAEQKRLALYKTIEALSSPARLPRAVARLELYMTQNPQDPSLDLLRIKAGQLWLEIFDSFARPPVNLTQATNALAQSRAHLTYVISQLTNSVHTGRAWLDLGWTYWNEGEMLSNNIAIAESRNAFQNAFDKLARGEDQALARFKIGDVHLWQKQYPAALTNYIAVLRSYADLPPVKARLFERAYQQTVRSAIEQKDFSLAESFVKELREAFPKSAVTERVLSRFGEALALERNTGQARAVFADFLASYPQSPLVPEVQLADARTYAEEGNWAEAIKRFDTWLAINTNHLKRAEAAFQRAFLNDQSGNRTDALALFTNFVTQFPQHALAPAAQNWVADYFYDQERWDLAEQNYQRIFQNTNWMNTDVAYQSRLMAARTAFFRQGYNDAHRYLTNLITDPATPQELLPEVLFTLGDVLIEQPITASTNALYNYEEAARIFDRITSAFPTNKLTPLALGKKGDCHLQLAVQYPDSFTNALTAYQSLLGWTATEVPVSALNQAEYGLAMLLERSAEKLQGPERQNKLKAALDHLLNIVHGRNLNGRRPDPFYLKKAGLAAGRITEALGEKNAALNLYQRLLQELPAMRPIWEARIRLLQRDESLRAL